MKTTHALILSAAVSTLLLAAPAQAQFGSAMKLLSAATGQQSQNTAEATVTVPSEASQEALVQRFARSQAHSLNAQIAFANAFGLAEQVQLLEAERLSLSSGAVNTDAFKKASQVAEAAQKAISDSAQAQPQLSSEAHAHYAQGLAQLALSVAEARNLALESSQFVSGLKSVNPMQMATLSRKLVAGAWVAKESPGYIKTLYANSRMAMTYARANKIKLPANADSMLDGLE